MTPTSAPQASPERQAPARRSIVAENTFPAVAQTSATTWRVRSKSHPATSHVVRTFSAGALHCSCPAQKRCWHMTAVESLMFADGAAPVSRETAIKNRQSVPVVDPDDYDPFADVPMDREASIYSEEIPAGDSSDFLRSLREGGLIEQEDLCQMSDPSQASVIWSDRWRPLPPRPGVRWGMVA